MSGNRPAVVDRGTQALADDYHAELASTPTPLVQGCPTCRSAWFPPRLRCPCGGRELHWWPAGGAGRVVAIIRTHGPGDWRHRPPARYRDRLPFDTAIVEPVDWPGVRLATFLERSATDRPSPQGNMPVRLSVHEIGGKPTPIATITDRLEGDQR